MPVKYGKGCNPRYKSYRVMSRIYKWTLIANNKLKLTLIPAY